MSLMSLMSLRKVVGLSVFIVAQREARLCVRKRRARIETQLLKQCL